MKDEFDKYFHEQYKAMSQQLEQNLSESEKKQKHHEYKSSIFFLNFANKFLFFSIIKKNHSYIYTSIIFNHLS